MRSDAFVAHYTSPLTRNDAAAWLAACEAAGLSLENPQTRVVNVLDREGLQVPTDRESLARTLADLATGQDLTFQFWLTDSTDVSCFCRRVDAEFAVRHYHLDGLLDNEMDLTIAAAASQIGRQTPRTYSFLVDRRGAAADLDLNTLARERANLDPDFPGDLFLST